MFSSFSPAAEEGSSVEEVRGEVIVRILKMQLWTL
jgi:hypothetical protein